METVNTISWFYVGLPVWEASKRNYFSILYLLCNHSKHFSIHDHQNSHCFVKVLEGTLRETRFAWPESEENAPMKEISKSDAQMNDVTYMSGQFKIHIKLLFVA